MTLYPKLILDALATVRYPGTGKNLVEADMVADNIRIDGMSVSFSLTFEKPTDPFMKSMVKAAETAIHTYVSPDVQVTITTESRQAARPEPGKMVAKYFKEKTHPFQYTKRVGCCLLFIPAPSCAKYSGHRHRLP